MIDLEHIPQKKVKLLTTLPNGNKIPPSFSRMVGKKIVKVEDIETYNNLIEGINSYCDEPFEKHGQYELYIVGDIVLIYDESDEEHQIWVSHDSPLHDLDPDYWLNLSNKYKNGRS